MEHLITVFTPTYNRAYIINKLYESLKTQTQKNFEWLVIDDGSCDNTEQLFAKISAENNDFKIRYVKQQNGGKHRATNRALDIAAGDIFLTVDSDDKLTFDAIEKINIWFRQIDKNIIGVIANRGHSHSETPNYLFSEQYIDTNILKAQSYTENGKKVLNGERAICIYTDVLKKNKYPEFEHENFLTEAVLLNRISHNGKNIRYYNDIICIGKYLNDGLTKAGSELFLNNPRGYGLWLKEKSEFMHDSPVKKFKMHYTFVCDLKDRYSDDIIGECIGISTDKVKMLKRLNKFLRRLKR